MKKTTICVASQNASFACLVLFVLSAASSGQTTEPATQPALTLEQQIRVLDSILDNRINPPTPDDRVKLATQKLQLKQQLAQEGAAKLATAKRIQPSPRPTAPPATDPLAEWRAWEDQQQQLDGGRRPFELKGDRMGMSYAMWNARHRDVKPFIQEYPKVGVIQAGVDSTIAGVDVSIEYKFVDGRLYEIEVRRLYQAYFDKVYGALKDKCGEPTTRKTEIYQNGYGAQFQGDVLSWSNSVSMILYLQRSGVADMSSLKFIHIQLSQAVKQRTDALEPGKKDL